PDDPWRHQFRKTRASSYPFLADAGSRPGNCSGMEEATGAPSSITVFGPKRLRASGRDGGAVMTQPPSPLTMLFSRHTKRRQFITLLGGAAAWPLAARAQQPERMRRIAVLMNNAEDDPEGQARAAAFLQGLPAVGWTEGKNLRIDWHWTAGDVGRIRSDVTELVGHPPDIIVANGRVILSEAVQVIRSIPIVFVLVNDPVGQGFISSLARPGGNVT